MTSLGSRVLLVSLLFAHLQASQSSDYEQAKERYEKQEYLAAMLAASRAVEEDGDNAHAHYLYGLILTALGQFTQAEEHLRKALDLEPNEAAFHYALGAMLIQQKLAAKDQAPPGIEGEIEMGTEAEMLVHLERALELDPNFLKARLHLGRTCFEQNLHDQALRQFRALMEQSPQHAWGHYHIGLVYQNIGAVEDSIREFTAELELYPDHTLARIDLGKLLVQTGRAADGLTHLLRAREEQPEAAEVHTGLAKAYREQGRFEEAVASARKSDRTESAAGGWTLPAGATVPADRRSRIGAPGDGSVSGSLANSTSQLGCDSKSAHALDGRHKGCQRVAASFQDYRQRTNQRMA